MRRVLGAFLVLALVLVGLLYAKLQAQQRATEGPPAGSGTIEGTRLALGSRIGGRVLSIEVVEGAAVEAGALVATVDCREPTARLAEADARIAAALAQVETARAQALVARRSRGAASAMVRVTDAQGRVIETHQATADRELARVEQLGEFAPTQRRDQATDARDTLLHQEEAATAQRRASAAQASVASAQAGAAETAVLVAEQSVAAVRALREVALVAVGECEVRAPRAGIIEAIDYEVGEIVAPGAAIVRLVELDEVRATFYLPNAELAAASVGGRATVVADAWPGETFEGHVLTVAPAAEFTPRTVQTRTDRDRLVFPIEVRVANADHRLRPGMPVEVTLVSP